MSTSLTFQQFTDPNTNSGIKGNWGYAIYYEKKIWIPVIIAENRLKEVLQYLTEHFNTNSIIFSAVLNPERLKKHLKHIVREWNEYFEEIDEYSHCIEIEWRDQVK